ncbi:MAG TPA: aryl-sulfate sulfotransferase [Acidimicrobiales bacterium]|nr:aryl-sulfate sulfotransferase [Acidimicrobiales bacterium]
MSPRTRRRWLAALAVTVLVATACSDSDGDAAAPAPADDGASSATTATGTAVDADIEVLAAEAAPLTADLRVRADVPVVAVVTVDGPTGSLALPEPEPATEHRIPVMGLRADAEHTITVELRDVDGTPVAGPTEHAFVTDPLPDEMPPIATMVSEPDRMAAGYTLFNLLDIGEILGIDDGVEPTEAPWFGWLVIVDDAGEVVWYHRAPHPIGDVRVLDDGTILHEYNDTGARHINVFGEVLDEWAGELIRTDFRLDGFGRQVAGDDAVPVATDSMHHHVDLLPNGNLLTLSSELRAVDGFDAPLCGEDPADFDGTYHLIGDVIVEFEPDGDLVREWSLFDHFPLPEDGALRNVCGIPNPGVFPNWMYQPREPRARDWTHANAVELDAERNALIVSIRHLDAIVALRYEDDADGPAGEMLWEIGPNGTFALVDGDWSYHQHAPEVGDDGSILVYDNGNGRPNGELYSRAVLYDVDDDAGTVTQLWEHVSLQDGEPAFAAFVGDADRLPNGNVLVTDGGLFGAVDDVSAQIVEVVPADDPADNEIVFELRVTGGQHWAIYRADRLADLPG